MSGARRIGPEIFTSVYVTNVELQPQSQGVLERKHDQAQWDLGCLAWDSHCLLKGHRLSFLTCTMGIISTLAIHSLAACGREAEDRKEGSSQGSHSAASHAGQEAKAEAKIREQWQESQARQEGSTAHLGLRHLKRDCQDLVSWGSVLGSR